MKHSADQLAAILEHMAASVKAGDSFEGSIAYSCMADDLGPGEFSVDGGYRIGNLEGQGGYRLLGDREPPSTTTIAMTKDLWVDAAAKEAIRLGYLAKDAVEAAIAHWSALVDAGNGDEDVVLAIDPAASLSAAIHAAET